MIIPILMILTYTGIIATDMTNTYQECKVNNFHTQECKEIYLPMHELKVNKGSK